MLVYIGFVQVAPLPPAISVLIASRDEPALANTLDSLREQCAELNAECIVVDLSEGRLEALAAAHPWVRWIDADPDANPRPIARQRNMALAASRGDVVAFIDCGAIAPPGWLAALTGPIRRGEVACATGPIFPPAGHHRPAVNDVPSGTVVHVGVTANLAVRREAVRLAQGFEGRLRGLSDAEFTWRLEEHGSPVVCVREAALTMDWGNARHELKRHWQYGRGMADNYYLWHERGHRRWRQMALASVLLAVLVGLVILGLLAAPWWGLAALGAELVGVIALLTSRRVATCRPVRRLSRAFIMGVYLLGRYARTLPEQPAQRWIEE